MKMRVGLASMMRWRRARSAASAVWGAAGWLACRARRTAAERAKPITMPAPMSATAAMGTMATRDRSPSK